MVYGITQIASTGRYDMKREIMKVEKRDEKIEKREKINKLYHSYTL